jgi:hypothetical protein
MDGGIPEAILEFTSQLATAVDLDPATAALIERVCKNDKVKQILDVQGNVLDCIAHND